MRVQPRRGLLKMPWQKHVLMQQPPPLPPLSPSLTLPLPPLPPPPPPQHPPRALQPLKMPVQMPSSSLTGPQRAALRILSVVAETGRAQRL